MYNAHQYIYFILVAGVEIIDVIQMKFTPYRTAIDELLSVAIDVFTTIEVYF